MTTPPATAGQNQHQVTTDSWWMGKDRAAFAAEVAKRFAVNKPEKPTRGPLMTSINIGMWRRTA